MVKHFHAGQQGGLIQKRANPGTTNLSGRSTAIGRHQSFALTFASLHELLHLLNTGLLSGGRGRWRHGVLGHGQTVHVETLCLFFLEKLELTFQELQAGSGKVKLARLLRVGLWFGLFGNGRQQCQRNALDALCDRWGL